MLQGELGVVAKEHYLNTARQMKAFEDKLYENWLQNVENTLNTHLKKPILAIGLFQISSEIHILMKSIYYLMLSYKP